MKCPNCGNERVAYDEQRNKRSREMRLAGKNNEARTNFNATCKKCGWKGEIR